MQGRLNIFQRTMVRWSELHPYSAVHVAQVRGPLEATRLRHCIHTILEKRGLTRLRLDCERFAFQYLGGPADCEISILAGEEGPWSALVAEMERQLNVRFDPARPFSPFRFLLAPAGGSFFLALVYFHPVADAESVVGLMRDLVSSYAEEGTLDLGDSLELYPDSRAHLLWRHPGVVARKLLALPAEIRRMRQSRRVHYRDADNLANGLTCFSLAPEELHSLVAAARSWEVTVNDLLLALLLKSLSPCAVTRVQARKRRKISVGCIVNVRKDQGLDRRRRFGLFLGSFTVTHAVPEGISLQDLARSVRAQTSAVKRHRLYLGTPLALGFARFMLTFFSTRQRRRFYAKHYPLWGGVTNMNLNGLWEPKPGGALLDYFRGVSTGPVTPLVLSVTTVGDRMNVGLSYRTTVFSKPEIESLQGRFREHLATTRNDP
jgi:hypothetical protein